MQGPLLICHPGADIATADVYNGLVPALKRLGIPLVEFPLNVALYRSGAYFRAMERDQRARGGPFAAFKATSADILYHAACQSIERAHYFGCEWVLIMSGMYFHLRTVKLLRRTGLKIAVVLSESPYDTSAEFAFASHADLCWTNERTCVPDLRLACPRTQYLPHAFDPERHRPDLEAPDGVPAHDVVFVGTAFEERVELLSRIDWTGIDLGLYGAWSNLGSRSRLRRYVRSKEIDNVAAAALYRKAKVGLNLFRQSVGFGKGTPRVLTAESLNPRLLELAACGVPLVSEWRPEVEEVFGETVPTFRPGDAAGAGAGIRRLLADDAARQAAAEALPRRVAGRDFDAMARTVARDLMKADADGEPWRPLEERFGVA